jgi:regulator of protease activity HflC (stomatin/prohibitin superfamily)
MVETLGRYNRTIQAGFHILGPFIDRIAYKLNLKEEAMDIPEQVCITRDNVQVGVDGVLYLQVLDASKASYGITNYRFAIVQLAQTTLRSEIGKIELDRTLARQTINSHVVAELDRRRALGRQGAALRDQEHQSAEGHPAGHGKADARGGGSAPSC